MLDGSPLPTVTGLFVRGSSWAASVPSYLIPVGSANQFYSLPWANLDEIQLTFNKDVIVRQSDLSLLGINTPSSPPTGFGYDPKSFTATWMLSQPLGADKSQFNLSDSVHDAAGNHLDGEWSNGSQVFPSGNGVVAANFSFQVDVLPGDVDQSGVVNIFDMVKLRNRLFATSGDPNYSVLYDLNGDGGISAVDGGAVRSPPLAGYQVKLDLSPSNGKVTFGTPTRTDASSPSRTPLFNSTPDSIGSAASSVLVTDLLPSGATPILDQSGLFRVPITIAPGGSGTFNLNFEFNSNPNLSNTLLSDTNGSPIAFTPHNGVLTIVPVPEPSTVFLVGVGLALLYSYSTLRQRPRDHRRMTRCQVGWLGRSRVALSFTAPC